MLKNIYQCFRSTNSSLLLIGLMFLLPFIVVYHHLPIPSFYAEWIAAALGLLAMLSLLKGNTWQTIHIPQVSLIFLGLAAILGMQWMLGMLQSHQYALLVLSYLVWGFFLVFLGSHLRRELGWEKIITTLAWFLVAGGAIGVIIVALQYAMQSGLSVPFLPKLTGYGAVAQANHFADYMALATTSLIYLYAKQRMSLVRFFVALVLFIALLTLSGSRSTWLYLGALTILGIALQAVAIKQQSGTPQKRSLVRTCLLLIPVFAIVQSILHFTGIGALGGLPAERLFEAINHADGLGLRWQIWLESWRMFLQSPWLGIGAGQTAWQSFLLLNTSGTAGSVGVFEHAHNLLLHLLTEMGIAAPLLVIVGIVAWIRGIQWREFTLETWWMLGLLVVIGLHSMLDNPLWYAYFLGIAAFLLGAGEEKHHAIKLPAFGQIAGRAGLAGLMLLGAVNLGSLVVANAKLETHLHKALKGELSAQQETQYFTALDWVHQYSLLAPYAELMYAASITVDPAQIEDKLWVSQAALRFMPMRKIAYQHVLLLKLSGDHAGAVQQLRRAMRAYPGKITKEIEAMPFKYWPDYLDVLSEAVPPKLKIKSSL
ncbi:MAG: Wzy polymerase domain-containing protein [Methylotenera sp.]|nr:Wzy polymerase domain-containing protein [Methylotenera sp.]